MSIKVDLSGLEKLQRNLEKVSGEHEFKLTELMTDDFIRKHTHARFQTLQAFLDASGIEGQQDIGSPDLDCFIAANTDFKAWDEMTKAAGAEWAKRQLGF
jgi:hypothetical protein